MTAVNKPMETSTGRESGRTIRRNTCIVPQPSIVAASSSSSGNASKKVRMMNKYQVLTSVGRTIAHIVSSSPSFCTTRKVGIIPPPNISVNAAKSRIRRRPGSHLLASG